MTTMPGGNGLERRTRPDEWRFRQATGDELEADGHSVPDEIAGQAEGRMTRHVEWRALRHFNQVRLFAQCFNLPKG
jgi:hypothetical protein